MTSLLLSIALLYPALTQDSQQPASERGNGQMATQKIDGEYTTVYVEMDGKKIDCKTFTNVTIKNNVATCRHAGKEMSWRLEFGPHHMIRCTLQGIKGSDGAQSDAAVASGTNGTTGSHTHYGVYIASPEYLCFSLNKGQDRRWMQSGEGQNQDRNAQQGNQRNAQSAGRWGSQAPTGGDFVLILRRAGAADSSAAR